MKITKYLYLFLIIIFNLFQPFFCSFSHCFVLFNKNTEDFVYNNQYKNIQEMRI